MMHDLNQTRNRGLTSTVTRFAVSSFVPKKESQWVSDDSRSQCTNCKKEFHLLLRRKHHCRGCGEVYCDDCTPAKLVAKDSLRIHEMIAVRVCQQCFSKYAAGEGESLHSVPSHPPHTGAGSTTNQMEGQQQQQQYNTKARAQTVTVGSSASHSPPSATNRRQSSETNDPTSQPSSTTTTGALESSSSLPSYALPLAALAFLSLLLIGALTQKDSSVSWQGILILLAVLLLALLAFFQPHIPAANRGRAATEQQGRTTRESTSTTTTPSVSRKKSSTAASQQKEGVQGQVFLQQREGIRSRSVESNTSTENTSSDKRRTESDRSTIAAPLKSNPTTSASPPLVTSPDISDLSTLNLTPQEAEIVRRSRVGLAMVESHYHKNTSGWLTKRITKPDGTGSIDLTPAMEIAQVDWDMPMRFDNTITIQTKAITDPFASNPKSSSAQRRVWKGVGLLPFSPENLFGLYYDQANQVAWNKALIESKVVKEISGTRTSITYVVSAPAVGGLVSPREFVDTHDWKQMTRVDKETGKTHVDYVFAGVGLEDSVFSYPVNKSYIRGFNGAAGFIFHSIDPPPNTQAVTPDTKWTRFVVLIDTDVKGWVPKSLVENAMPDTMWEYFNNARQVFQERHAKNLPWPAPPRE